MSIIYQAYTSTDAQSQLFSKSINEANVFQRRQECKSYQSFSRKSIITNLQDDWKLIHHKNPIGGIVLDHYYADRHSLNQIYCIYLQFFESFW